MSKASLVLYLTVALLLLLFLSRSPNKNHPGHGHGHRRLKLRSTFAFSSSRRPVAFDPLVAEIERRREQRQWEKQYFELSHGDFTADDSAPGEEAQPEWEDFIDAEDYLNDEEKFNVTDRLILLFPKIDVHPTDGFVSEHELTEWNLRLAQREILHRTKREMEVHDKDHDGIVSFSEYEPPSWVRIADNGSFGYNMGWWKEEHFNAADIDGDGLLNLTEYNDFLHPADSKNQKLLEWLCREEVR